MTPRILLTGAVAAVIWLAAAPNAEGWFRARYGYHYGGYGGGFAHYNLYTGGYYHGGSRGYNPYTGRYGASRTFYNPYTNRYAHVGAVYNPYTNRYAYGYHTGYGY